MIHRVILVCCLFVSAFVLAQKDSITRIIEYPFGEPGAPLPRGVFGVDERREASEAWDYEQYVQATAVMIRKDKIYQNRIYGSTLREQLENRYGVSNFHKNVKFLNQPAVGQCTGFLISPSLLVTAGHCISSTYEAQDYVWVFDYTNNIKYDSSNKYFTIDPKNIYEVDRLIISVDEDELETDYAVIRLTRKSERSPYTFRTSGEIIVKTSVNTIGSPTGLPLKIVENANVLNNGAEHWFKTNMDAFPGNSGGPVFDKWGFIEGILVRTAAINNNQNISADYIYNKACNCIMTLQWESAETTFGTDVNKIRSIPTSVKLEAIYDNLEYAIQNKSKERLDQWGVYNWIYSTDYTKNRGRLETTALVNFNLNALETILSTTKENIEVSYASELLQSAVVVNNRDGLELILENGINVDTGNSKNPDTPLFLAVSLGRLDMAKLLISYGANTNITSRYGNNLLNAASLTNDYALVDYLIEKGVSPSHKNNWGWRPEKSARKAGNKGLAKYLKKLRKRG